MKSYNQFLLTSGFLVAADGVPASSCCFLSAFLSLVISLLIAIISYDCVTGSMSILNFSLSLSLYGFNNRIKHG